MWNRSGNALFIILIAVALFGALSYAITQSNKGGMGGLSKEDARLKAAEIIQYAQSVGRAKMNMRMSNGCDAEEISFHHTGWGHTDYQHGPVLSDECNIYHSEGGDLTFQKTPPIGVNDGSDYMFTADAVNAIFITPSFANLSFMVFHVTDDVCKAINHELGLDKELPVLGSYLDTPTPNVTLYNGTFAFKAKIAGPNGDCTDTSLCEIKTGCFTEAGGGQSNVFFYYMLDRPL